MQGRVERAVKQGAVQLQIRRHRICQYLGHVRPQMRRGNTIRCAAEGIRKVACAWRVRTSRGAS